MNGTSSCAPRKKIAPPSDCYPGHHGTQSATLVKFNQKSVTILGDDQRQWRVSPDIVESLDAGE